jgi:hypothetical protein
MARLTIPDEQTFATFTVTTSTTVFPITFSLFAKADLTVKVAGVALEQSAFTFTGTLLEGGGYDGGTVTLNTAVDDVTVRIERNVTPARTSNFAPASTTPVQSVDQALNRQMAISQDHKRRIDSTDAAVAAVATDAATASSAADRAEAAEAAVQAIFDVAGEVQSSASVTFLDAGTGSVAQALQTYLRGFPVRPQNYGLFTSATVTTATLKRAFDYAIANKLPIELKGNYTVNGPIATASTLADCALDLRFNGDVRIVVDSGSTPFDYLLSAFSTAATVHNIGQTGGTLEIYCNDKVARAVTLVSDDGGTTMAGACLVRGVRLFDVKAVAATGTAAYGLTIEGPYAITRVDDFRVDGVSRHADLDATGDCKGLRIFGALGPITISNSSFSNVLNATQDADGAYVSGITDAGSPVVPLVRFQNCEFEDCQGRSIKTQVRHTDVDGVVFKRQMVVVNSDGMEVDSQYGSMRVENWTANYRKNGSTAPFSTSFRPFFIQALYNDAPKYSRIGPGELSTDAAMGGLAFVKAGANSPNHEVIIDGAVIRAAGALSTTALTRGLVEFSASEVKASSSKLTLRVLNTTSPNTNALITYTGGDGTDLSSKLEIHASGNRTTLAAASPTKVFAEQSGTILNNLVPYCAFGINPGYHQVFEGSSGTPVAFNWNAVPPGCDYDIDLDGWAFSNGPSGVPSTGYARVRSGHGERSWYVHLYRELTVLDTGQRFFATNATWVQDYPNKRGAAVPDAAGATPTKAEFDALLASLRTSGALAT